MENNNLTIYCNLEGVLGIREACGYDACPVDGRCDHCKQPVKVARLKQPSQKPNTKSVEEHDCEFFLVTDVAVHSCECERITVSDGMLTVEYVPLKQYQALQASRSVAVVEPDTKEEQEQIWDEIIDTLKRGSYFAGDIIKSKYNISRK
jgi:hypothetical protein